MLYKLCPFCNEIKPLDCFDLDYGPIGKSFTMLECNTCIPLSKKFSSDIIINQFGHHEDGTFRRAVKSRNTIIKKIKDRVSSRAKAASEDCGHEWRELLGVSLSGYKKYLEIFFYKNMTWDNFSEWDIDHVKPIKEFDLSQKSERLKAFHFTNTRPLFKDDHKKKGDSGPIRLKAL